MAAAASTWTNIATTLLDDVGEKLSGIATMALGYGSKNADNAAKGAKHTDDAAANADRKSVV